jgi:hypothetical protein
MLESYQNGFGLLPRLAMAKPLVRLTQEGFCNILSCVRPYGLTEEEIVVVEGQDR